MSWYNEFRPEWKQIIETVATETGHTELMVEKDTIQSMFLHQLSKYDSHVVFKGGTSLSKSFGLIERFSEDIDLSMAQRPTESEKKKIKKVILSIAENLGMVLTNPEDVLSRHNYNKYVFHYESLFQNHPLELVLETSFYQTVYPVEIRKVTSFIGQFCDKRNICLPISFEAAIFSMNVQSLERTLVDKVFAVCDYRLDDMQSRDSRHLYDIAKILPKVSLSPELRLLVSVVRKDRMLSKNNPSANPKYNIPMMLHEIISSKFYEPDYRSVTQKLLYEEYSYEDAIKNGIAIIAESDMFMYSDIDISEDQVQNGQVKNARSSLSELRKKYGV